MRHKIFPVFLAVSLFALPLVSFAETPAPSSQPETETVSEQSVPAVCTDLIQEAFGTQLDAFLSNLTDGKLEDAYKNITKDRLMSDVYGDITTPESIHHVVKLTFVKQSEKWLLDTVTEIPLMAYLRQTFPSGDALKQLATDELHTLQEAIAKNNSLGYWKHFSKLAKKNVKPAALKKLFAQFKKGKLDISIPASGFVFDTCSPSVNDQNIMIVRGHYQNEGFTVKFRFEYIKEWVWKLNGFNVDAEPLKKAEVAPPVAPAAQ